MISLRCIDVSRITLDRRTSLFSSLNDFLFLGNKPLHFVELLLADRLYKLRDHPETLEFYGPPHPEDPQGKN